MKISQMQLLVARTITYVGTTAVVLMLFAFSCTKSEPDPEIDARLQCEWPKESKIVSTITNETAILMKNKLTGDYGLYLKDKWYLPCNVSLEEDSVTVIVNGYALSTPQSSSGPSLIPLTSSWTPFEITDLKIK